MVLGGSLDTGWCPIVAEIDNGPHPSVYLAFSCKVLYIRRHRSEFHLHGNQLVLPLLHLLLEGLDVSRTVHRLRLEDVVVQHDLDVVHT